MKNPFSQRKIVMALLSCGMAQAALAATLPGPLVDTGWLASHLGDVHVVEVRDDARSYYADPVVEVDKASGRKNVVDVGGHIDGATLLDFKTLRVERQLDGKKVKFLAPEHEAFQTQMRNAGVRSRPIVIVPQGQTIEDVDQAARLYWTFKLHGEDNVAVLDGGMAGWILNGQPVSKAQANLPAGDWSAKTHRGELSASSDDVAKASQTGDMQLVDGRPSAQFFGIVKSPAVQTFGHVQGAKDLPPETLGRRVDGVFHFLPNASYAGLLKASGISADRPTISYCNTGHLASGTWFALSQLAGMKNIRLYDGSLALWTQEGRPLVNPTAQ